MVLRLPRAADAALALENPVGGSVRGPGAMGGSQGKRAALRWAEGLWGTFWVAQRGEEIPGGEGDLAPEARGGTVF